MSYIDGTGFHKTTRAQRLSDLQAAFVATYGTDISIEPGTPDGDWLVELAGKISDADDLLERVYLLRRPSAATGAALSALAGLTGTLRKSAQFSTSPLGLTGVPGTPIPKGSLVTSDGLDGNDPATWQTMSDATLDKTTGLATVQVQATTPGPIGAAAGHINKTKTVLAGWTGCINLVAASPGTLTETDAALRSRRAASTAMPSQGLTDSLFAGLAQIEGTTSVAIYENYTDVTDGFGLPPHSVQAVVANGLDADIAAAIQLRRGHGCTLVGGQSFTVIDAQGRPQVMRWDRPTQVPVYVVVNLDSPVGSDVQAEIVANIIAWGSGTLKDANGNVVNAGSQIGKPVVWSQLFLPINMVATTLDVGAVYLGRSPNPTTQANLAIGRTEIPLWVPANVSVVSP